VLVTSRPGTAGTELGPDETVWLHD
jgi:hypothetical protein